MARVGEVAAPRRLRTKPLCASVPLLIEPAAFKSQAASQRSPRRGRLIGGRHLEQPAERQERKSRSLRGSACATDEQRNDGSPERQLSHLHHTLRATAVVSRPVGYLRHGTAKEQSDLRSRDACNCAGSFRCGSQARAISRWRELRIGTNQAGGAGALSLLPASGDAARIAGRAGADGRACNWARPQGKDVVVGVSAETFCVMAEACFDPSSCTSPPVLG